MVHGLLMATDAGWQDPIAAGVANFAHLKLVPLN